MAIQTARRITGILLTLPLALLAQVAQPIAGSVKKVTGDAVLRRGGASMPVSLSFAVGAEDRSEVS